MFQGSKLYVQRFFPVSILGKRPSDSLQLKDVQSELWLVDRQFDEVGVRCCYSNLVATQKQGSCQHIQLRSTTPKKWGG